jgi:hypothetical protein
MNTLKVLVAASVLALAAAAPVFGEDAPSPAPATKDAPATAPVVTPPALIQQDAALIQMQNRMNALLNQRAALDTQINTLQKSIDQGKATAEKLAPAK